MCLQGCATRESVFKKINRYDLKFLLVSVLLDFLLKSFYQSAVSMTLKVDLFMIALNI